MKFTDSACPKQIGRRAVRKQNSGTAIGSNDADDAELEQFERIFNEFKNLQGAKHIYLCKTWDGKTNKKEKNVKIDSINVKEFLANAEPNLLYTVEL